MLLTSSRLLVSIAQHVNGMPHYVRLLDTLE